HLAQLLEGRLKQLLVPFCGTVRLEQLPADAPYLLREVRESNPGLLARFFRRSRPRLGAVDSSPGYPRSGWIDKTRRELWLDDRAALDRLPRGFRIHGSDLPRVLATSGDDPRSSFPAREDGIEPQHAL